MGLIVAMAFMGASIQFRVLTMLQTRLRQLTEEHRRRDEELERRAAARFGAVEKEREEWEKRHSSAGERDVERDAGTDKPASTAHMPLLMQDGTSIPGTPSQTDRPLSSVLNFRPGTPGLGSLDTDKPSQSPGLLPPIDLGGQVKSQLPDGLMSKNAMIDDHPEIRHRKELIEEIRDLRRSIGTLGKTTDSTRLSLGGVDFEADRQAAVARAAALGGYGSGSGSYNSNANRDRVKSMIAMPTSSSPLSLSSNHTSLLNPTSPLTSNDF